MLDCGDGGFCTVFLGRATFVVDVYWVVVGS